jgi:hypothetical protein
MVNPDAGHVAELVFNHWESTVTKPQPAIYRLTYLVGELLMVAWAASVQRANAFNSETKAKDRPSTSQFRQDLLAFAEQNLLPHYVNGCTEEQHLQNLLRLCEHGTRIGGTLFDKHGYRLGIAQKFFNLSLKSLWSVGLIAEPPHCPVDRLIIERTSGQVEINWTEITSVDEYLLAIRALKKEAASQQLSLAEWELRYYARRNPLKLDLVRLIDARREDEPESVVASES